MHEKSGKPPHIHDNPMNRLGKYFFAASGFFKERLKYLQIAHLNVGEKVLHSSIAPAQQTSPRFSTAAILINV
ncbi:hypothetical protein ACFOEY_13695 [Paracandidimonas soli]|uniref:hypothetical protein n=1 Tax=Paracandidimonas soli TaxID=1917182 RepID=UPI00360DD84E